MADAAARLSSRPHHGWGLARGHRAREVRALAVVATAGLLLAGCTAHADLTLHSSGTYDITLEMRDSTGTVLTSETNCEDFADPSIVGESSSATVTAKKIGSTSDKNGVGCKVTIRGAEIAKEPSSSSDTSGGNSSIVSRDGDLFVVDTRALAAAMTGGLSASDLTGEAESSPKGSAASAAPTDAATNAATDSPSDSSLEKAVNGAVDARMSITFPGAVVDADGGNVRGTTVTWTSPEALTAGVHATGYATSGEGMSAWDRALPWIIGSTVGAGVLLGLAALWRWRRAARKHAARA